MIGGGLPVGAFGGRAEIMDASRPRDLFIKQGRSLAIRSRWRRVWRNSDNSSPRGVVTLGRAGHSLRKKCEAPSRRRALSAHWFNVLPLFCEGPVRNVADARRSDQAAFSRYFHACLERGVYFAPSQFEAGFLSLAHTPADIERSAQVAAEALKIAGY